MRTRRRRRGRTTSKVAQSRKGDGLSERPTAVRRRSSPDPTVVLWRALGSIELCAALLGLLGAASLAASLLPQMPLEVRTGASPLAEWLLGRREQFGSLTPWMQAMSLFDVAHSWWFRLLIATLGVSLSVAVLRRAHAVLGASGRAVPRARRSPAGSRSQARLVRTIGSSLAEADARGVVVRTLRSLGYRLDAASAVVEPAVLRATRRRWARYGSLAAHVGLLLVLCASAVGAVTGFRDNN
ncbi:MAG: cytochrome c biogenesis protein ResB [Chloroflexia bacterium]